MSLVLALFVPGLGHVYEGKPGTGIMWFLVTLLGYCVIVPGLCLHFVCMVSTTKLRNENECKRRHRDNSELAHMLRMHNDPPIRDIGPPPGFDWTRN